MASHRRGWKKGGLDAQTLDSENSKSFSVSSPESEKARGRRLGSFTHIVTT